MHIQRSVKFLLHKRGSDTAKPCGVRMRVTLRGQTPIDIPTGFRVQESDWDTEAQRVIPSCEDAAKVNYTIEEWISISNEIFARYEFIEKRTPSTSEFRDLFNDMIGRETATNALSVVKTSDDVLTVFDVFVRTMGRRNQWTDATYEKFAAIKSHLKEFDPHMSLHQVNDDKMQCYFEYLMKKQMKNTTIAKHLAFVRWFFRWAADNQYYDGSIHKTFKPKIKGSSGELKEVIYLTKEELRRLEQFVFAPNQGYLERVRDVFLFCCFTGLRYSDVAKLLRSDVKDGYIEVITKKTNDQLRIELNKHSRALLDKYKYTKIAKGLALPVISNVKMNAYLKELGRLCEIDEPIRIVYFRGNKRCEEVREKWELLTTHCGRKTFVVTALQLGIPAEVIMKWTGHSNYSAMKPYIKIVDDLKARSMTKFDEL